MSATGRQCWAGDDLIGRGTVKQDVFTAWPWLLGKGLTLFIKQSCLEIGCQEMLPPWPPSSPQAPTTGHASKPLLWLLQTKGLCCDFGHPEGEFDHRAQLCGSSTLWPSIPAKAWRSEASWLDKMVQVGDLLNPKVHRCLGKHQFHRTVESQSSLTDPQGTSRSWKQGDACKVGGSEAGGALCFQKQTYLHRLHFTLYSQFRLPIQSWWLMVNNLACCP